VVNKSKTLEVTHQKISEDLNTSRVVVSRLLKTLENMKVIKQERSLIHLL
jgi:CRP/FNR family transcriptional regulator